MVFDNAYTPTSKCAPSRAAILTGRNPWQLKDAANHQPYFPAKFMAFSEALAKAGIACGAAGKTWGPGEAKIADGSPRNFGLRGYGVVSDREPGSALSAFLKSRAPGQPFFYWFGSHYPHRGYKLDSGIAAGSDASDVSSSALRSVRFFIDDVDGDGLWHQRLLPRARSAFSTVKSSFALAGSCVKTFVDSPGSLRRW